MKKGLFILIFLIPLTGFSQPTTSVVNFLGFKFGADTTQVLRALKNKGAKYERDNSCCRQLVFSGVKFNNRTAYSFFVNFLYNQAYHVQYTFAPVADDKVIEEYNKFVAEFTAIYGRGYKVTRYSTPFKADDGNTLHGLSEGKIDFHTLWIDDARTISVIVRIDSTMRVILSYQYEELAPTY